MEQKDTRKFLGFRKKSTIKYRTKARIKKLVLRAALYMLIALGLIISFFPVYEMIATSFKNPVEAFSIPPKWFFVPIFDNYREVLVGSDFARYFINSIVESAFTVFMSVGAAAMAAYALARRQFIGKAFFSVTTLLMRMIPPVILVIPVYLMYRRIGLAESLFGLTLVYTALTMPFSLWIISVFIRKLPISLEESAYIDGCNTWQVFYRIIIPLITPALATAAIFTFRTAWNEFILALILTNRATRTLPVAVSLYITDTGTDWGRITAIATIIALPALIFTFTASRQLITGVTAGAIKA